MIRQFRRFTAGVLQSLGHAALKASRHIYLAPQDKRVIPWFRDRGDMNLRLQYVLGPNALVVDAGGYEGQWSSDIYAMYQCRIDVFEPVFEFAQAIELRFKSNPCITVHRLGLGNRNTTMRIGVAGNGSSIYKRGNRVEEIAVVRAADYLRDHSILPIDLLKINIEGAEYDLLDHLIESGLISAIRNIQVQFHDFVPDAESRMTKIQRSLAETHALTYQYLFVWENWQLKTG
jgi:FkbM family methyltransferase